MHCDDARREPIFAACFEVVSLVFTRVSLVSRQISRNVFYRVNLYTHLTKLLTNSKYGFLLALNVLVAKKYGYIVCVYVCVCVTSGRCCFSR